MNGSERTAKSERKVKECQGTGQEAPKTKAGVSKGIGMEMISSDVPLSHKVYNFKLMQPLLQTSK